MILTKEIIRELLNYDKNTGSLTWKPRTGKWFTSHGERGVDGCAANWNSLYANKPALTSKMKKGHLRGTILGKNYLAHRIIWLWMTGEWPDQVDHINGNPSDNRWENLRNVDGAENKKNTKLYKNNKSGHSGIFYLKKEEKWLVSIQANGRLKFLGHFRDLDDAIKTRKEAEAKYGFHINHGRNSTPIA